MLIRLHVVITSSKEEERDLVKNELLKINPTFSISPFIDDRFVSGYSECYITCQLSQNQLQPLLNQLNNDWDEDEGDYTSYGFNTKMFHPLVYSLHLQVFE